MTNFIVEIDKYSDQPVLMSVALEIGEIQKFSRLAEQVGSSNNKFTVNCFFSCKNQGTIIHFNVISKIHIAVFLCESTIEFGETSKIGKQTEQAGKLGKESEWKI